MRKIILIFLIYCILPILISGCAVFGGKTTGKITTINENLCPDRLTDLSVVKKLAGHKKFLFFSGANYTDWFEGFLQGKIIDEDNVPVEGIQVMVDGVGFENAVTDINGIYKIRFSIPIVKGIADSNGKLIVHPKWESELEIKGLSWQPLIKDATFRIYYNGNAGGVTAVNEGKLPPQIVVKKITKSQYNQYKHDIQRRESTPIEKKTVDKKAESGTAPAAKPAAKKEPNAGDDLFKALEDFNK